MNNYRNDIDGLRAISVISIILYHFFPSISPGGFVGVDIFFVISGYLLIGQFIKEYDAKNLLVFYFRRARRILPALYFLLLVTLIIGYIVMYPAEFFGLLRATISSTLFYLNFRLNGEAGYFDIAAINKPLLHLWSLSVEEQFYIGLPLMIVILKKIFGYSRLIILIFLIAILSLAFCVYQTKNNNSSAFYLLQFRAWEFLFGGLCSLWLHRKGGVTIHSSAQNKYNPILFVQLIGFFILISSLLFLKESKNFPGIIAALPVLGTCLILISRDQSIVTKFLESKYLTPFGKASYSLYLYHWPIISYLHILNGNGNINYKFRLVGLVVAIFLGFLSYRFIEVPFRKFKYSITNLIFFLAPAILVICVCLSFLLEVIPPKAQQNIYTGRVGVEGAVEYYNYMEENFYHCLPVALYQEAYINPEVNKGGCYQSKPGSRHDIALIGDSHAEALFVGLANNINKNIVYYYKPASPFLNQNEYKNILQYLKEHDEIKIIVIANYYNHREPQLKSGLSLRDELDALINYLNEKNRKFILVQDLPDFDFQAENCLTQRNIANYFQAFDFQKLCKIDLAVYERHKSGYLEVLSDVAKKYDNVEVLLTGKYFCDENECSMTNGNKILYRDVHHLNLDGSLFLGKKILENNSGIFNIQ